MGEPLNMQIVTTKSLYVGASEKEPIKITTEKYLKSAVEWLREQQYKELCRLQETNEGNFEKVIALIHEAFPDLNPKGSDNTRKNPEQKNDNK